jgi:hypothetical protein
MVMKEGNCSDWQWESLKIIVTLTEFEVLTRSSVLRSCSQLRPIDIKQYGNGNHC